VALVAFSQTVNASAITEPISVHTKRYSEIDMSLSRLADKQLSKQRLKDQQGQPTRHSRCDSIFDRPTSRANIALDELLSM
jgi:hypothetical protein